MVISKRALALACLLSALATPSLSAAQDRRTETPACLEVFDHASGTVSPNGEFFGNVIFERQASISGHLELSGEGRPEFTLRGVFTLFDDLQPWTGHVSGELNASTGRFRLKGVLEGRFLVTGTIAVDAHGHVNENGTFTIDMNELQCITGPGELHFDP